LAFLKRAFDERLAAALRTGVSGLSTATQLRPLIGPFWLSKRPSSGITTVT
jgi:hypothetical protein